LQGSSAHAAAARLSRLAQAPLKIGARSCQAMPRSASRAAATALAARRRCPAERQLPAVNLASSLRYRKHMSDAAIHAQRSAST
jgi:hypothetical protein